jgi:hypothetical protein
MLQNMLLKELAKTSKGGRVKGEKRRNILKDIRMISM